MYCSYDFAVAVGQRVDGTDNVTRVAGLMEVVEGQLDVLDCVVENCCDLVDGVHEPKHHAQGMKDIGLRLG